MFDNLETWQKVVLVLLLLVVSYIVYVAVSGFDRARKETGEYEGGLSLTRMAKKARVKTTLADAAVYRAANVGNIEDDSNLTMAINSLERAEKQNLGGARAMVKNLNSTIKGLGSSPILSFIDVMTSDLSDALQSPKKSVEETVGKRTLVLKLLRDKPKEAQAFVNSAKNIFEEIKKVATSVGLQ